MGENDDELDGEAILALPMQENDAGATTVKAYLVALVTECWDKGEGFSGKRPFGNSGWEYDLYRAVVAGGAVTGSIDEYGDLGDFDSASADEAIHRGIEAL